MHGVRAESLVATCDSISVTNVNAARFSTAAAKMNHTTMQSLDAQGTGKHRTTSIVWSVVISQGVIVV